MGCFRVNRRRKPGCTGTAFSCLQIYSDNSCTNARYSKRKYLVKNNSYKDIWASFDIFLFEMDGNRILRTLPNEPSIIRKVPGKGKVELLCEEVEVISSEGLWVRRTFVISQACYEQDDIQCRYFPSPPPQSYNPCEYKFLIDFNENELGRKIGIELRRFYQLLIAHMTNNNLINEDFNSLFPELSSFFEIDRGPLTIENRKLKNYGSTDYIYFDTNIPAQPTAWLKLQNLLEANISLNVNSIVLDFSKSNIPPSIIIGNCDINTDPADCEKGAIERPVKAFVLNERRWIIEAYEYCLNLDLNVT